VRPCRLGPPKVDPSHGGDTKPSFNQTVFQQGTIEIVEIEYGFGFEVPEGRCRECGKTFKPITLGIGAIAAEFG
jgi:hypothetical protein